MNLEQMAKEYAESAAAATHLLLIAHTKMGKTDYVAQAAIDGWEILYIDNDNGLNTLMDLHLPSAVMKRIHYFAPKNMAEFVTDFIQSRVPIRFDSKSRSMCNSTNVTPGATISEIYPMRVPKHVIVALDSWTSLTLSLIMNKAAKLEIDLLDADKFGREVYGGTGFRALEIAKAIQSSPFNWIVQAHPAVYERKEKPAGRVAENIEEKDMIIKETTAIPQSTSNPNGFAMGKYFNQIGWMTVDTVGNRKLDFKVIKDRIGGGSPAGVGDPRVAYRFSTLFGKPPAPVEGAPPWIIEMSAEEYKAVAATKHANAPKLTMSGFKPATK